LQLILETEGKQQLL